MLRITRLSRKRRLLTLKFEGDLRGPGPPARRLDLAAVTYVDAAGLQLLRDLVARGADIAACSSFVGELLHPES